MQFSDINKATDLVAYLNDSESRLRGRKHVFHYTTFGSCVKILKSKRWILSNAKKMNDKVEYYNGDLKRWRDIFFASFMTDAVESIGMWSMYSQPWQDGVQISIPVKEFKKWIKGIECIHEIGENRETTGRSMDLGELCKVFLSSVAYSNCDNSGGEAVKLMWGTVSNEQITDVTKRPELTGYIKDMAWAYEKEIRIKASFPNEENWERVAIDIPDDVLESFTITAGPLFSGSLYEQLYNELGVSYKTAESAYTGKLMIPNVCDKCRYNKECLAQAAFRHERGDSL